MIVIQKNSSNSVILWFSTRSIQASLLGRACVECSDSGGSLSILSFQIGSKFHVRASSSSRHPLIMARIWTQVWDKIFGPNCHLMSSHSAAASGNIFLWLGDQQNTDLLLVHRDPRPGRPEETKDPVRYATLFVSGGPWARVMLACDWL